MLGSGAVGVGTGVVTVGSAQRTEVEKKAALARIPLEEERAGKVKGPVADAGCVEREDEDQSKEEGVAARGVRRGDAAAVGDVLEMWWWYLAWACPCT